MKRKHDTRDVPPDAKRRVSKGVAQAMLTVFGKDVWCDLTPTGRAKVVRPEWYASLRMADGSTKLVKLCRDKLAAEMLLSKLRTEQERISVGISSATTVTTEKFSALTARYWALKARTCTDVYLREAQARLAGALAQLKIDSLAGVKKLTAVQIEKWLDGLKLSNGSKIQKVIQLKGFMKWLLAGSLIRGVPEFPKILDVAKYVRRPLTRAEVDLLQANSPWPRGLFYALAFATLARRGALLSLTKSDVHLGEDDSSIMLRAQHAKTKITQQVPVPKRLVEPLRRLIDECPANVPLFHSISGLNIHHMFRRDLKTSGIEHETERGIAVVHSLRHGGTTELLEKGVSVLLVQRMGGWKTLRVLSKHYAHLSPIRSRSEIDKVFG